MLKHLYHHCTTLEAIDEPTLYGRQTDHPAFKHAYQWWEQTFGYTPLFIAVGRGIETIKMTGYPNQFKKPQDPKQNNILLSFSTLTGHYHKFDDWEDVLAILCNEPNNKYAQIFQKRILKAEKRTPTSWERTAKRLDGYVQMCLQNLQPKHAEIIYVKNKETKKIIMNKGFKNVEILNFSKKRA